MTKLKTWVSAVGFKDVGENVYRGRIHSDHLQSVQQALTEMGLTCAHSKTNFEIWSSEGDKEVVLINQEIMMNSGIRSGFSPVGLSIKAAEIAEAVHEFETAYPMFAGVPIEDMLAGTGDIKCEHRCLGDDVVVTIVAPLYGIVFTRSF